MLNITVNDDCSTENFYFNLKKDLMNRANFCSTMAVIHGNMASQRFAASHKARQVWLMTGTPAARDAAKLASRMASEEFILVLKFKQEILEIERLLKNM